MHLHQVTRTANGNTACDKEIALLAIAAKFPGLENPHFREHDEKAIEMLRHMIEGVSAELPETINELRESATLLFDGEWLGQA